MDKLELTNVFYWIAMIGIVLYFSYSKGWILANFESIDAPQAKEILKSDKNVTLLDVRTLDEFKSGHIKGAKHITLSNLEANLNKLKKFKDKKIIVYCRSGSRSVAASRILEKNGFTPLNVKSGMIGLMGAKMEIVK
ncbi:Rhodanese-like domain protein [hydrothermal vent metagenome]|uniref:Rhodanese-like domain protein n=1 Tax=hydrothermal vent metagenome TaxID=652676 RepID=A0A1W1EBU5_9ZZZZ